jgi:hypothetical protein
MLVKLDLWPKITQLSVIHQFCNVRGGKRFGTTTRNVIKVLGHNIVNKTVRQKRCKMDL